MVVCNTSYVQAPTIHSYTPGTLCPISPVSGLSCGSCQRYPVMTGTPVLTVPTLSCGQGMSASTVPTVLQISNMSPTSANIGPTVPAMQTSIVPTVPNSMVDYTMTSKINTTVPCTQVVSNQVGTQYITTTTIPNSTVCRISSNVLTIPSWKQSYGMEQVWQCEFKTLFSQYAPHTWLLLPVTQKPTGNWNSNIDSAKVRFCCEDCGHGWTSMKGRVGFWFILNPNSGEGAVCLKLYGQQCDRCKKGKYEPAMWYPEEVLKVLVNIYNKVGQAYYGFQQAPYHRTRRAGKPRTPHNSELCQACKDGICSEQR